MFIITDFMNLLSNHTAKMVLLCPAEGVNEYNLFCYSHSFLKTVAFVFSKTISLANLAYIFVIILCLFLFLINATKI